MSNNFQDLLNNLTKNMNTKSTTTTANPQELASSIMDSLTSVFNQQSSRSSTKSSPVSYDTMENGSNYIAYIEAPGLDRDSLKVTSANGYLDVTYSKKYNYDDTNYKTTRAGRTFGSYHVRFPLRSYMDCSNITCDFSDGVIYLRIPKVTRDVSVNFGTDSTTVREGETTESSKTSDMLKQGTKEPKWTTVASWDNVPSWGDVHPMTVTEKDECQQLSDLLDGKAD